MNTIEILPGVTLRAVQTKKYKTASLSISLLRPLCSEEAAGNALIPSVLLRGTKDHPDMAAISDFLDTCYGAGIGGLIRKKGEVQTLGFYADFINDRLAPDGMPVLASMISFLGELLLQPVLQDGAFVPEFVEGEKLNLLNTIASRINDKRGYASRQMLRAMFAGEAYATDRLGEPDEVKAITPASLYEHYQMVLAHSQVEVFYVGEADPETAAALLKAALSSIPRAEQTQTGTVVRDMVAAVRTVEETMDVTQGKLCMGLRTAVTGADARYPALLLLNTIYGGGVASKLFRNVREKHSICYYANSALDKHKGVMAISSGIDCADYEKAKAAILAELEDCKAGRITEEELETARQAAVSALQAGMDSPGRMDDYSLGLVVSGCTGTMEDLTELVRGVTVQQVIDAANTLHLDTIYFLKGMNA